MISRPDSWTHIKLTSSLQVKDTNCFSGEDRTDLRAGGWSAKVMLRCMTDTIAKKYMQYL